MAKIKRRSIIFPIIRRDASKEVERELNMRVRVWGKVSHNPISFIHPNHNRQYETLQTVLDVLSVMTNGEWEMMKRRWEAQQNEQQKLF